jgi:hypothetical protein
MINVCGDGSNAELTARKSASLRTPGVSSRLAWFEDLESMYDPQVRR